MTVEETIHARRSIRRHDSSAPTGDEDLDRILEARRLAPSGINLNVPDTLYGSAIRPAEAPPARRRRALEEIVIQCRFPDASFHGCDTA